MKVLITGAGGMLAHALIGELDGRGHAIVPLTRGELDVTDARRARDVVSAERPDVVIQCAAYTRVDDAENDEAGALRVNAEGALNMARASHAAGARFVYPSTDYVFDGTADALYSPTAPTAPLSAYGRSKLAGEQASRAAGDFLIVRTAWLYGHAGAHFVRSIVRAARAGAPLRIVDDQHGSPTWTADLAVVMLKLLEAAAPAGIWHATNAGHATWYELGRRALQLAGIEADVRPVSTAEWGRGAPRPARAILDCSHTEQLVGPTPHWSDALRRALDAGVHEH